jgi:hypothetical protein
VRAMQQVLEAARARLERAKLCRAAESAHCREMDEMLHMLLVRQPPIAGGSR